MDRVAAIERTHKELGPKLAERKELEFRMIGTIAAFEPREHGGYLSGDSISFGKRALERGVLLRPLGQTLYFLPPYATTEDDLFRAYDVLEDLVSETYAAR
jgi:adenosylmethionine-8-amino-7-oxononanoate aminotransferase